ncbi:MAG: DNA-directed RNA polymerase subunit omega [Candidatus Mcinerneyibacterium aminivorans]|uniref:DNA-directed RNA polymerase subunit omega n=1 Tax=Candidatus Mcinerneyibacterium aminivorans TaxID=2703815 RepID=A0A5D0MIA3_9BACT|nr:MAG: DNA-directed RNA polymerase subunit omega [Candidatus Mcinerneyibacterium aminivorans]
MEEISIEKFIEATGSIYASTVLAFKKAKQLGDEGYAPTIDAEGEKVTTIAIKEVADKKVVPGKGQKIKVEESE